MVPSQAGNPTWVFHVTGGDTYHYTTEDWLVVRLHKVSVECQLILRRSKKREKKVPSPAGNRTRVFRVTGGDTYHYTTEDWLVVRLHKISVECQLILRRSKKREKKSTLPGRESNPGLPRDRRRYSPLYYRGLAGA